MKNTFKIDKKGTQLISFIEAFEYCIALETHTVPSQSIRFWLKDTWV